MVQLTQKMQKVQKSEEEKNAKNALTSHYANGHGDKWEKNSGETLCLDNCQLIGMPFFHTRLAGKNNHN